MTIIERFRRWVAAWPRLLARPFLSQDGSVAVMTAIAAIAVLGMVSLGIEVTGVLLTRQRMQSSADAAAMAGAQAIESDAVTSLKVDAQGVAASDGFTSGTSGEVVTVNNPPLSGTHIGTAAAVEVIISQPQTLPLSGLLYTGTWNVSARAVALAGSSASSCVLTLNPGSVIGVSISNGAVVNMNACGLAVNAAGASALTVTATLNASSVTVVGSTNVSNGGAINVTGAIKTAQPATANPYASVAMPTFSGCNYGSAGNPYTLGYSATTVTLSPGVYCGGMSLGTTNQVNMNPGVYIINGAGTSNPLFQIVSGTKLSGTGVTIVLTGSGSNYTTVNLGNGATINLSAPTTGATAGLVFFQDPSAPTTGADTFTGGASMVFTGALYFPTQTVTFQGGTTTTATCTQLIAWMIVFQGGASFNSNCASIGISTIGGGPSTLVE